MATAVRLKGDSCIFSQQELLTAVVAVVNPNYQQLPGLWESVCIMLE